MMIQLHKPNIETNPSHLSEGKLILNEPREVVQETNIVQTVVMDLAEKLKDPSNVKEISLALNNRNPALPQYEAWNDCSLAQGYPSLAVFYSQLHHQYPEGKFDLVAHQYIQKIVDAIDATGLHEASLFYGLAGICYAVATASQKRTRYRSLLEGLEARLITQLETNYLPSILNDVENSAPTSHLLYELLYGITGIGAYVLAEKDNSPALYPILQKIITTLIRRTEPIIVNGVEVPGWYSAFEHQYIPEDKQNYPQGNFNTGISHGITGVLAFLSIAMIRGILLPGQKEAIKRIVNWLRAKAFTRNGQISWAERVTWDAEVYQACDFGYMQRMGWCYGKPAILRTLSLAGLALNDKDLLGYSHRHFLEVFELEETAWNLPGPMFCHGLLGLYAMTKQMADDTRDPILLLKTQQLLDRVLGYFDPTAPFSFREIEAGTLDREKSSPFLVSINKVGLLNGSVGIGMALLDYLSGKDSHWDFPFLISSKEGLYHADSATS